MEKIAILGTFICLGTLWICGLFSIPKICLRTKINFFHVWGRLPRPPPMGDRVKCIIRAIKTGLSISISVVKMVECCFLKSRGLFFFWINHKSTKSLTLNWLVFDPGSMMIFCPGWPPLEDLSMWKVFFDKIQFPATFQKIQIENK